MQALFELIRCEIVTRGVLPFDRFMELALYCPDYGYYQTKKDNPGRRGDYFTSVSVGELFGQLLAFQFASWLETENEGPKPAAQLVEAGAHDGTLARDILVWLQANRPGLFEQIEYCIVEPSAPRQEWQKENLKQFAPHLRWVTDLKPLARRDGAESSQCSATGAGVRGVIFSNELLDAMPVRRLGWDAAAKQWFEWGVGIEGERFVWVKILNSELPTSIFHLPSSLLEVLPDGYTLEISPAAETWWREAASVLDCGRLMTMDYGLDADELILPGRPHGTLRGYFRHHVTKDLLDHVGEQDLTAHVNFPTIRTAGESAGLTTERFSTQAQFLTRILDDAVKNKLFGEWNASRTRQFQTLTHPEHLGRAFRVLVQVRTRPAARN